jgi:hypothetical protein
MSDDIEALWREVRILQLQMTGIEGIILARAPADQRVMLKALFSRKFLERAEEIDRQASDDGEEV